MSGPGEKVEILLSVPLRREALEDVLQIANALNDCLGGEGIWADVVGEGENAHFVILRVPHAKPQPG